MTRLKDQPDRGVVSRYGVAAALALRAGWPPCPACGAPLSAGRVTRVRRGRRATVLAGYCLACEFVHTFRTQLSTRGASEPTKETQP